MSEATDATYPLTACGQVVTYSDAPEIVDYASLEALRAAYGSGEGRHWFDADTLRWFGSRGLDLIGGAATVECQTKAPEGVDRYRVTVWLVNDDGTPYPGGGCRHASRREAVACASGTLTLLRGGVA